MENVKGVFSFLAKKEVYGLALIILIAILVYHFGKIGIEKIIISGKNDFERKKKKYHSKINIKYF